MDADLQYSFFFLAALGIILQTEQTKTHPTYLFLNMLQQMQIEKRYLTYTAALLQLLWMTV